jgi:hypothetical protein
MKSGFETFLTARGLGVRQPSGALGSHASHWKSGGGPPQSKTLARLREHINQA